MFIGFFSFANTLTVCGLMSSVISCFLAAKGNIKLALYMLFIAYLCDSVDGTIARRTPHRTESKKCYGIQLDSLCDIISFGLTPCFIAFSFGFDGIIDVIIYCLFIACGATRLAYFNTLANENPDKPCKSFRGVPIPVSAIVITVLFVLTTFIPATATVWIFRIVLTLLAISFILNIRIKKPSFKTGAIIAGVEIALLLILLIAGDCKVPANAETYNAGSAETSETSETSK